MIGTKDGSARPVRLGDIAIFSVHCLMCNCTKRRSASMASRIICWWACVLCTARNLRLVESTLGGAKLCRRDRARGCAPQPDFGLADETLFWLATRMARLPELLLLPRNGPPLWNLSNCSGPQPPARILGELRQSKDRSLNHGTHSQVLELTGYDAALAAEFLGDASWRISKN